MRHKVANNITILGEEYILASKPDEQMLAKIFNSQIKKDMKLSEIASKTAVNITTLSRISKGKITDPLSKVTIERIASITDDKDRVIDMLVRANGFIPESEFFAIRDKRYNLYANQKLTAPIKKLMKMVLIEAYVERGLGQSSKFDKYMPSQIESVFPSIPLYDFVLPLEIEGEVFNWVFYIVPQLCKDYEDANMDSDKLTNKIIKDLSQILLTDAWEPDVYEHTKITIVLRDQQIYDKIFVLLSRAKLHNLFSICLIDDFANQVKTEYSFETVSGKTNESKFLLPVIDKTQTLEETIEDMNDDPIFVECYDKDKSKIGRKIEVKTTKKKPKDIPLADYVNQEYKITLPEYQSIIDGDRLIPREEYDRVAEAAGIPQMYYDDNYRNKLKVIMPVFFILLLMSLIVWFAYMKHVLPLFWHNSIESLIYGGVLILLADGKYDRKILSTLILLGITAVWSFIWAICGY